MARVLIGWELGANRGHAVTIAMIVDALRAEGHEIAIAAQQVDMFGSARDRGLTVFQAPLWPGLIASAMPTPKNFPATFIDILCRLGLERQGTLSALIRAWDALLDACRPDVVIAEFAPALLAAARGRIRSLSIGTGFAHPPAHLQTMPRLIDVEGFDEALVADTVDDELRAAGRPPLPALPALFAADDLMVATFDEIDPYRAMRPGHDYCPPLIDIPEPGGGDELFVYAFASDTARTELWNALRDTRLPIRTYCPGSTPDFTRQLREAGIIVEANPLPWSMIAARSRLVLSHGGHGFVCSAMLAGVPQVVTHYDLEKALHAALLEGAELGRGIALRGAPRDALREVIATAYADEGLSVRTRNAAPGFRDRMTPSFEDRLRMLIPN